MLKSDMKRHLEALCSAIGATVSQVRPAEGACRLCGEPAGKKHAEHCAVWPIIQASGDYRNAEEEPV